MLTPPRNGQVCFRIKLTGNGMSTTTSETARTHHRTRIIKTRKSFIRSLDNFASRNNPLRKLNSFTIFSRMNFICARIRLTHDPGTTTTRLFTMSTFICQDGRLVREVVPENSMNITRPEDNNMNVTLTAATTHTKVTHTREAHPIK